MDDRMSSKRCGIMGISGIVVAVLLLALLVVQGLMLGRVIRWTRMSDEDTELKQLVRRAVELTDECVALQEETNRLLRKVVFEEADDEDPSRC
jgi:hypothetical protein